MTTTTKTPNYFEQFLQDARAANWGVFRRAGGKMQFVPPDGGKGTRTALTPAMTKEQARQALTEAGLYPAPEPEPEAALAPAAGTAEAPKQSTGKRTKQPCPECGNLYGAGPGLSGHRRARHGITNTTTVSGQISSTGIPLEIVDATQALLSHVSAELTRLTSARDAAQAEAEASARQADEAGVTDLEARLAAAEEEITRLQKQVTAENNRNTQLTSRNESLDKTIQGLLTKLDDRVPRTQLERRDEEIRGLKDELRELRRFKSKVGKIVSTDSRSLVGMIVDITKAGGPGFIPAAKRK